MTPEPAAARRIETLLEHREWVRALARSLVARPADAEDVEQQTWVAALRSAPDDARSMRAWLATVARNAARKLHRGDGRRRRREDASEPRGPSPSAAALAERAEIHSRVVTAVVALDEPYREAVLLRYFEGVGVEASAVRAGVPLETMRARLRRARDMLRARLGEECGPERPWRLALLPLLDPSGQAPHATAAGGAGAASAAAGGTLMGTKLIAGVVAAAVLAGAVWWTTRTAPEDATVVAAAPRVGTTPPARAPRPGTARAVDVADKDLTAATPVALTGGDAAAAGERAATPRTIRERLADTLVAVEFPDDPVVDSYGRLAELTSTPVVVSREVADAAAGRRRLVSLQFEEDMTGQQILDLLTRVNGHAYVIEDDRIVITPGDGKRDAALAVVVPPRPAPQPEMTIRGRVTDASGAAVAGAQIVHVPGDTPKLRAGHPVAATTNASGDFEARIRPPLRRIQAFKPGHVRSPAFAVSPDAAKNGTFALVLRGPAGALTVRVMSDAGPVAGATVTVGPADTAQVTQADGRVGESRPMTATTDAQGVARWESGVPVGKTRVAASRTGHQGEPREVEVVADRAAEIDLHLVAKRTVAEVLAQKRMSINVNQTPARDVLGYLSKVGDVNIVVLPSVAERFNGAPIDLKLENETLAGILQSICNGIGGVTYEVRDDVVVIDALKK